MAKKAVKKSRKKPSAKPPTPAEVVAAIRETSRNVEPDPKAFKAAADHTEKYTKAKDFNWDRKAPDGVAVYYFHRIGETLTGVLGQSQRCSMLRGVRMDYEHLHPLVLDDDQLVYLPNNKHLRECIKKANCLFQRVTITYLGKKPTAHGHYVKVYSVEPAPLGKDGVGKDGHRVLAQAAAEAKGKRRAKS
jgi:hypothetical protein